MHVPLCYPHIVVPKCSLSLYLRTLPSSSFSVSLFLPVIVFRNDYDASRNCVNVSSFYCHHQNVTSSRILLLVHTSCTPFMSLHFLLECYLQGINFDILCQKILFTAIFGIMQKCSQELFLWVFAYRVCNLK